MQVHRAAGEIAQEVCHTKLAETYGKLRDIQGFYRW